MTRVSKVLVVFLFLIQMERTYGQQDPQYSQYMFNTLAVNPAYAGSREVVSATALYRKQWVNTPGSPSTGTFSIDAPFKREKIGLGLVVFNDKIGVTNTTGMNVSYAFRIRLNKGTLALGLQGGFSQLKQNLTSVVLDQNSTYDEAFATNVNKFLPNFGAGVYYNTDRFYIGVGLPRVINDKLYNNNSNGNTYVSFNSYQTRQLFVMSGCVIPISQDVKLKPSTLIKMTGGAPVEFDLNTNVWFYDAIAAGVSYRTSAGTFVSMIEIQATKQIRVGYAYDLSVGKVRLVGQNTHEIMARYEFGYVKAKILSPRYF
ncbi:MAG TPA: type IX secretion system membrane protein PorP/SprF [Cytophagaceae bacterium]|jgi:type IX secretion system PorP/SprF family membrane protein|nr:type IX secretion system membrane protein PorP/SprF [Cytophagaceae bacterium]